MGFLETLKSIFNIEKINIDLSIVKIIKNDHSKKVEVKDNNLIINVSKSIEEKDKIISEGTAFQGLEEGFTFLEDGAVEKLEDFQKYDQSDATRKPLGFLKNKIPSEDINIWRAALYLREHYRHKDHKLTTQVKREIRQKYGDKGGNIANLCSAEYLENFLEPLYFNLKEQYEAEDEAIKEFKKTYKHVVTELPFTIFVSHQSDLDGIKKEISKKRTYGHRHINIHGIGSGNTKTIENLLEELEENTEYKIKKQVKEEGRIFVRLEYIKK
jgi:hypothetical protein